MQNHHNKTMEELIKELRTLEQKYNTLTGLYNNNLGDLSDINQLLDLANKDKKLKQAELDLANKEIALQNREKLLREEATRELEAFSYSVSHDLRAPLRHINGYVELLLNRHYEHLPEKAQHYLSSIADSARQMDELINNLLEFSRTGRREVQQANVDMNAIVDDIINQIKKDFKHRKIVWHISPLPPVFGDEEMLKQVWKNLLDNAVKFTRDREETVIKIDVADKPHEYVFSVTDNGVGFDVKYAHNLFGVFQRLHSYRDFEGTGIGLALVRSIVLKHRGLTWAEAEPDKGATFYFSLPKNQKDEI
jgi:light-regulated signal transduction histidine kinase (bacteriophytochrome)